jgi:pimeloyl-ACP methyl ester carboxylesterase
VGAAATAARYPELIRRLILVAGWGNSLDPRHQLVFTTWAQLTALDPELGNRYLMSVAFKPAFLTGSGAATIQGFIRSTPQPNIERRIDLGRRIDIRGRLPLVKCPTLIVRGSHDYLVPAYQTRVLHEQIRHSECVELDSGHAVFFEQPGAIVELTRRFLLRPAPQERDTPKRRPMP